MRKNLIFFILLLIYAVSVLAQTSEPTSPARTPDPRPAIDLTATQILAQQTATAEAFPVPPEQVDAYGGFVFVIAIGSMLVVLIPLAYGLWRMNRGS